jgi:hypothetical protein
MMIDYVKEMGTYDRLFHFLTELNEKSGFMLATKGAKVKLLTSCPALDVYFQLTSVFFSA